MWRGRVLCCTVSGKPTCQVACSARVVPAESRPQPPAPPLALVDKSALINQDLGAVQARLMKHVSRPAAAATSTPDQRLCDVLSAVASTSCALLDECFSLAAGARDLWARDGQKGARSMRKKGLIDSIKSLLEIGVALARVSHMAHNGGCTERCINACPVSV